MALERGTPRLTTSVAAAVKVGVGVLALLLALALALLLLEVVVLVEAGRGALKAHRSAPSASALPLCGEPPTMVA